MCGCSSNCSCNSTSLPIGPKGDTGAAGADGAPGANGTNGVDGMAWYSLPFDIASTGHLTPSYDTKSSFIFPGTGNVAVITKILATLYVTSGINGKIKIYDVTNANDIATFSAGTTSTSPYNIVDLGVVSNLPATPAIFEIRIYNSGITALDVVYFKSLMIGSY